MAPGKRESSGPVSLARNSKTKPARGVPTRGVTFVNISHPDDIHDHHIQAGIRRHVAGDVGRARRKGRRNPVVTLEFRPQTTPEKAEQDKQTDRRNASNQLELITRESYQQASHPSWPLNQHGILGMNLDARTLQLVHFIHARSEYSYRAFQVVWIRVGLSDTTAFLLTMASAAIFRDKVKGLPTKEFADNAESAEYYSQTMRQLSRRLSDPVDCMSPGVVATVLGCICHDTTVGDWQRWAVHMEGLEHIRRLRGGFDGLENNIPIMTAWLDLAGSCYFDTPPRFELPHEIPPLNDSGGESPPALTALLYRLEQLYPELSSTANVMRAMSALAETVNGNYQDLGFWRDEKRAFRLIGPLMHQLLSLPRLDYGSKDPLGTLVVAEMARLACLMLISDLKTRFSLNAADGVPLREKFLTLEPQAVKISGEALLDLKLWALMTFGLLHSKENRSAILPHIRRAAIENGAHCIRDVMALPRNVIWIEILEEHAETALKQEIAADLW